MCFQSFNKALHTLFRVVKKAYRLLFPLVKGYRYLISVHVVEHLLFIFCVIKKLKNSEKIVEYSLYNLCRWKHNCNIIKKLFRLKVHRVVEIVEVFP